VNEWFDSLDESFDIMSESMAVVREFWGHFFSYKVLCSPPTLRKKGHLSTHNHHQMNKQILEHN
jgi:hypothetical protein